MKRKTFVESTGFKSKDLITRVEEAPITEVLSKEKISESAEVVVQKAGDIQEGGGKKKRIRHRTEETVTKVEIKHDAELSKAEREALKRRSRKQVTKERKMDCFLCRQKGHSIANCPRNTTGKAESDMIDGDIGTICYKCGSLEHILAKCVEKGAGLPFSTCFVCKQKGHLAGQCPENEKGVYPNGGSCKYCGSVRHLASECKPLEEEALITLGTMDLEQGADDDDQFVALYKIQSEMKKVVPIKRAKTKVVNF